MTTNTRAAVIGAADERAILAAMSPVAREIVSAIGLPATLELLWQRGLGGKRLVIPARLTDTSPLVAQVGMDAAQRLVEHMGGPIQRIIDLPMLVPLRRLLRDNAIRADFDAGVSENTLVDRYGMPGRTIRKILAADVATSPRRLPAKPLRDARTYDLFRALNPQAEGLLR